MDRSRGHPRRNLQQRLLEAHDADAGDDRRRHGSAGAVHRDASGHELGPVGDLDVDRARRVVGQAPYGDGREAVCGGGVAAGQHAGEEPLLPRELAGADQVHLVVDALERAPIAASFDLSVGRSLLDELGMGQKAAAATRNRCEDAPVEPDLTIHLRTLASGCDTFCASPVLGGLVHP
ncbi:MAG TPA: hypothetical protein VM143_17335 [Acidimicrobiales bacterium]|nr:hypothetical protein [Acidimicrobiales bacterium]